MGMGNIVAPAEGRASLLSNAAGTVWKNESFILTSYRSQFLIRELSEKSIAIAWALDNKSINAIFRQEGDYRLNEQHATFNYAQRFGKELVMGTGLNYFRMSFSDQYGEMGTFYSTFSIQLRRKSNSKLSFSLSNPSRQWISIDYNQRLESRMTTAYSHVFSPSFSTHLEISKTTIEENEFRLGLEYKVNTLFSMRTGYELLYRRMTFGLSIRKEKFILDLAFNYISAPGFSMAFGLSYLLKDE